ncbi:MAG: leucine-rich repeat domain-containing protein [Promethearchaeota archaeon]|jgi:Leucine-rich repeat (LRR) protein/transposase-like protein
MSERKHGRRYSFKEKQDILDYLEKHTYKDTSEKFKISETTLSRWRNEIKSGSKKNRSKIIISLPKFWLEYLNEEIESDVWENYSEAFLSILRDHFRNQKSMQNADSKYLDKIKGLIPKLLDLNPDIDSILLTNSTKILHKTERWESTEGISNLIEEWEKLSGEWKKASSGKIKGRPAKMTEFEFQNDKYNIRDLSVKHLIGVPKGRNLGSLLGLKKKLEKDDIYIIAKIKESNNLIFGLAIAMNTLKKIAMGVLPTPSEEKYWTDLINKSKISSQEDIQKEYIQELSKRFPPDWRKSDEYHQGKRELEQNKLFQIKSEPLLMQLATQVNKPLKPEEKKVLDGIEKQIGKPIERINADPAQETNKANLGKIPWINIDIDFPAHKYSCHYIALNGEIILLSLFNMDLSEMPSEISKLTNLTYLCLATNHITTLPRSFSDLKSLEILILNNNQFIEVPDSIIELPRLYYLYMKNNNISKIPVALTDAWQARVEDSNYQGSIYIPCNIVFSGNPIDRSSLTKEQIELEQKSTLNIYRYFLFVID